MVSSWKFQEYKKIINGFFMEVSGIQKNILVFRNSKVLTRFFTVQYYRSRINLLTQFFSDIATA